MEAVKGIIHLIRYRFLLFAGLLPYCLGAAIARHETGSADPKLFMIGLAGLFFVLAGVETFNEYFDWHLGSDRVFELDPKPMGDATFRVGVASFAVAAAFAVFLSIKAGWGILAFAAIGSIAAYGYLGPPFRFTYRGLGELVIALSYGPSMVMGSYYLQTGDVRALPLFVSAIPAVLLTMIAIMNEVPDFIQDGLVGKRNLCVRLGRERVVELYGALAIILFAACAVGLVAGILPKLTLAAFAAIPLAIHNYRIARRNHGDPLAFLPAIRGSILLYMIAVGILIAGFL